MLSIFTILVTLSNNAHCFKHQEYEAPTIGIISGNDERWYWLQRFWRMGYWSYVARSYVNLIEQTGARAVAVPFDLPIKQFQYLLDNIHGLIIPGLDAKKYLDDGSVPLIQKRIGMVIEHAKKKNDEGIYWPILGECHGLQATLVYESGNDKNVESCGWHDGFNKHSVNLLPDFNKSKLWNQIDHALAQYVFSSGELHFSHACSVTTDTAKNHPKLKGKLLVTGKAFANRVGKEFMAMAEYKDYPIFLTQFHVEKTQFERIRPNAHISRDPKIVEFSFQMMMAIIGPTRQYALPLDELDSVVRSFLLIHHHTEKSYWDLFEEVYYWPRSETDWFTPRTFAEQLATGHNENWLPLEKSQEDVWPHSTNNHDAGNLSEKQIEKLAKIAEEKLHKLRNTPAKNEDPRITQEVQINNQKYFTKPTDILSKIYTALIILCVLLAGHLAMVCVYMSRNRKIKDRVYELSTMQ